MRSSLFILILLHLTLQAAWGASPDASPTDHAFTSIPSQFSTRDLSVGSRSLGEVCLSWYEMPNHTVCNPAFLHLVPEGSFVGDVYVGNGYTALSTANQFLFKPLTRDFLENLFQKKNTTSLEFNAGMTITGRGFSARFTPYRVQYLSEVHNPNFPVVAVHAALERSLEFSGGKSLAFISPRIRDWSAGANLRLLDRHFLHGSFSVAEIATEDPRTLLPVKSQQAVFLDPVFGWRPSRGNPWRISTSFGARNLGMVFNREALYPEYADLEAGIGAEPPVRLGRLHLGLDLVNLLHADTALARLRTGVSYQIGILELMSGYNDKSVSAGMQMNYEPFQGGIVYEFMRSDVQGNPPENRIATEFAVRL